MLKKFVKIFGGDPNKRTIEKFNAVVEQINSLEPEYEAFSDEALREKTAEFRARLAGGETLDDLLPEGYAAVREASKRSIFDADEHAERSGCQAWQERRRDSGVSHE